MYVDAAQHQAINSGMAPSMAVPHQMPRVEDLGVVIIVSLQRHLLGCGSPASLSLSQPAIVG
jgi:hypothetical protein